MEKINNIAALQNKAVQIRKMILKLANRAGSLHLGGDLSMTDMMVGTFYHAMNHDPACPKWEDRDRFVLSKGHGAGCLYVILADTGYFPEEEMWSTAGKPLTHFGTHPCKNKTPGVEVSTGSLGHGICVSVGMALAAKLKGKHHKVYTLIGDGETQEGTVWEAAMAAASYGLDNLVCMMDRNKISLDGPTEDLMALEPLDEKWKAFGWNVIKIDGNDMSQVVEALDRAGEVPGKPTIILGYTTKGKGIPYMENDPNGECYLATDGNNLYVRDERNNVYILTDGEFNDYLVEGAAKQQQLDTLDFRSKSSSDGYIIREDGIWKITEAGEICIIKARKTE